VGRAGDLGLDLPRSVRGGCADPGALPRARLGGPHLLHDVQPPPGRAAPAPVLHVDLLPHRGRGPPPRSLPEPARDRARADDRRRPVHDGRGRVHRGLRPRAVDDDQRHLPRADGRGAAGRPARPTDVTSEAVLLARIGRERSQSIDTYVADGGYEALRKVLGGGWTPEAVTEEVKKSGL